MNRGRFTPSPTGPLRFGSLVAALASYLDARSADGEWLVRIEDLDTARTVAGADLQILHTLEQFGFEWSGPVMYHGLFAYQLAVVVDDAAQGITDVVRGADLLDSTPRQIYLQRLLGLPQPRYLHSPIVANEAGEKLSKQTFAPALNIADPAAELKDALRFLRQRVPTARTREILRTSIAAGIPPQFRRVSWRDALAIP